MVTTTKEKQPIKNLISQEIKKLNFLLQNPKLTEKETTVTLEKLTAITADLTQRI